MEELDSLFAYDRIKEALERLESAPFEQNLLCVKVSLRSIDMIDKEVHACSIRYVCFHQYTFIH